MTIICECCKGERYLFVVDAAHPDDPPRREPCGYCGAKGYTLLTTSEAATYATGQDQNQAPGDDQR